MQTTNKTAHKGKKTAFKRVLAVLGIITLLMALFAFTVSASSSTPSVYYNQYTMLFAPDTIRNKYGSHNYYGYASSYDIPQSFARSSNFEGTAYALDWTMIASNLESQTIGGNDVYAISIGANTTVDFDNMTARTLFSTSDLYKNFNNNTSANIKQSIDEFELAWNSMTIPQSYIDYDNPSMYLTISAPTDHNILVEMSWNIYAYVKIGETIAPRNITSLAYQKISANNSTNLALLNEMWIRVKSDGVLNEIDTTIDFEGQEYLAIQSATCAIRLYTPTNNGNERGSDIRSMSMTTDIASPQMQNGNLVTDRWEIFGGPLGNGTVLVDGITGFFGRVTKILDITLFKIDYFEFTIGGLLGISIAFSFLGWFLKFFAGG